MKKLSLILIALCTCATFYCERDTNRKKEWPRDLEPRLSNASEWNTWHPDAARRTESYQPCIQIDTADDARYALSFWPRCLDKAIAVLEKRAEESAANTSDYAAALYERARRDERPEDFLEALQQANLAVTADPALPDARFNRALILEKLGARDAAIEEWSDFIAMGEGGWRREALARRDGLRNRVSDAELWEREQPALAAALRAGDAKTVERIIEPFPSAAVRHFEEVLLLQWADRPSDENVEQSRFFAEALSRRLDGDPFPVDTVEAIARAKGSPEKWNALREGHRAYVAARTAHQRLEEFDYTDGLTLLVKGDSPFQFVARVRKGEPIAAALQARNYRYYAAVGHWQAAVSLQQTRFREARREYENARTIFRLLRDPESLTAIQSRMGGLNRYFGDHRSEWSDVLAAHRNIGHLIDARHRTVHYFEVAAAARRWNRYDLALVTLDQLIAELKAAKRPPSVLLAFALAHRAQTALDQGSIDAAERDLDELESLGTPENIDPRVLAGFTARTTEVSGVFFLKKQNAPRAVDLFTAAIQSTEETSTTLRASRLALRAEAHLLAKDESAAKADLEEAVAILQREGQSMLAQGAQAAADEVLNPYFDRFQSTYRKLIDLYMKPDGFAAAFAYAELARAAEPLNLVGGQPTNVRKLLEKLPPHTYVLEYCILDDKTYYWLIGNGRIWARRSVPRSTIERWRDEFHKALNDGRIGAMQVVLNAAHEQLVAPALEHIPRNSRIVIIPDGALYAFPFAAMSSGKEFLVQRAIIEYSGSAALYLHSLKRDAQIPYNDNLTVLAVGNPAFDPDLLAAEGLYALPHAEEEADEILSQYGQTGPLTGKAATVPAFFSRAPGSDVIHIAAHAVINDYEPARSAILFAPSDGRTGALEPHELLQLRLDKTRLMVLSACETGGGLPIGSEGVAPLVRPALAAGVPGVVATLWSVNDDATTRTFMVSLHAQYAAGHDAAIALRDAQLAAIEKQQSVRDWAAFQVIGHASSPRAPSSGSGGTSIGIHASHSLQRPDGLRSQ